MIVGKRERYFLNAPIIDKKIDDPFLNCVRVRKEIKFCLRSKCEKMVRGKPLFRAGNNT